MQRLPPKRANLPAELFNMRELPSGGGEEEEEEEDEQEEAAKNEDNDDNDCAGVSECNVESEESTDYISHETSGQQMEEPAMSQEPKGEMPQEILSSVGRKEG